MLVMATETGPSQRTQLAEKVAQSVNAVRFRCKECDRLWSEHSKTTFQHIRVENDLKLAVLERNVNGIEWLTQATGVALRLRKNTLEAIHKHKATHPEALLMR